MTDKIQLLRQLLNDADKRFDWSMDSFQSQAMAFSGDGGYPPEPEHAKWAMIAVLGLCGEAGEVAELFKKLYEQDREFSREKLVEELSDCLWYLARVAAIEGINLSEVAQASYEKLAKRYPDGFVTGGGVRNGQ
jgi:NTP pyrophosphatase (non-canonical NTP hydrolase)